MPLQISEIGVRLATWLGSKAQPPAATALTPDQMEQIVEQSVQRVLERLKAAEPR